jgi:hypothetical protein
MAKTGRLSKKKVLRWSVSYITMRSGRIASTSRVTAAKKRAVSHCGPSRSTSAGKNGVCGTPSAPTISATVDLPLAYQTRSTISLGCRPRASA